MPRTVFSVPALVACLLVLVAAPAALAQDTRSKILRECQDGRLVGDYSIGEIRDARNNIPDDIDQYSDCRDVLSRALADRTGGGSGTGGGDAGGAGGGGGSGGGGPLITPSTDEDRRALEKAGAGGGAPVEVGGQQVVPGAAGLASDAVRNTLPSTLIAALVMLAVAAILAGAPFVRRRALSPIAGLGAAIRRRVLPGQ